MDPRADAVDTLRADTLLVFYALLMVNAIFIFAPLLNVSAVQMQLGVSLQSKGSELAAVRV